MLSSASILPTRMDVGNSLGTACQPNRGDFVMEDVDDTIACVLFAPSVVPHSPPVDEDRNECMSQVSSFDKSSRHEVRNAPYNFYHHLCGTLRCTRNVITYSLICAIIAIVIVTIVLFASLLDVFVRNPNTTFSSLSIRDQFIYVTLNYNLSSITAMIWMGIITGSCLKSEFDSKHKRRLIISTTLSCLAQIGTAYVDFLVVERALAVVYNVLFVVTLLVNFYIIYCASRNDAASRWYHMPMCFFCLILEVVNGIVVLKVRSYTTSVYFQWISPFLFSGTAQFIRYAAQVTVVSDNSASKLSTASIGLNCLISRMSQARVIDDLTLLFGLELFYSLFGIFIRVSLYYRHALFTSLVQCKFTIHPNRDMGKRIGTDSGDK